MPPQENQEQETTQDIEKQRTEEVMRAAMDAVNSEIELQFRSLTLDDGVQPASVSDVYDRYVIVKSKLREDPKQHLRHADKAIIHTVDSLSVLVKATEEGLVTDPETASRLATSMGNDEHIKPAKVLSYLRGKSSWITEEINGKLVPVTVAPTKLAGALEVHSEFIDFYDFEEGQVSIPMIIRAAQKCGIDLANPDLLSDEDDLNIIYSMLASYEFIHDVSRATKYGNIYHTKHHINPITDRDVDDVMPNPVDSEDERDKFDDGLSAQIEDDPDNASMLDLINSKY